MSRTIRVGVLLLLGALTACGGARAAGAKFEIGGTTYTKWLWGNQQYGGSLYNFTTVPGEGYGDNGQGTELELLLHGRLSNKVEFRGRVKSRFNQNEWTNYGGFGGRNPALENPPAGDCVGGDCGEADPRSAQYMKLRGVTLILTPGYSWLDAATIGSSDWGMFDPMVIGRIRYIDRDNGSGLLFQGSALKRKFHWDVARISLPRLWAGPGFQTGNYTAEDACYGLQAKYNASPMVDVGGIFQYVNDIEVDPSDNNWDNGRVTHNRFRNNVYGLNAGLHPTPMLDLDGAWYYSFSEVSKQYASGFYTFGLNGYSPTIGGKHNDRAWKADADINDPFGIGLSFTAQAFEIGSQYVSMFAARRESDVLLTEGHDGTWAFPGPSNASYGVFGGNATRIGYGGWDGNAQQVATINVDNEFTDFDETMAETATGWKGFTIVPTYGGANGEISGEYSYITYDTNWQAYGDDTRPLDQTWYPTTELDTGVGHNFRSAYAPFQDKKTDIAVLKGKYTLNVGKGIALNGKVKYIKETDNRLNDPKYLPYNADGDTLFYYGRNTTLGTVYAGPPPEITVNGVTGPQWKPFTSITDDDRDLKYTMFDVEAGYPLTNELSGSVGYTFYHVDLTDGNTAFQAYRLHEMASGKHQKNQITAKAHYVLTSTDFGLEYQYNFGTFEPDFGDGFVVQYATADDANNVHVAEGSPGVRGAYGNWNSLAKRVFIQQRIKAYVKVQF